ncbi:hypothetical protein GCM10009103_51380 [Pseudomonas koreensis]|nr:hypothetical protein GCM10009103_51380 [Pseudomonas koreensis]
METLLAFPYIRIAYAMDDASLRRGREAIPYVLPLSALIISLPIMRGYRRCPTGHAFPPSYTKWAYLKDKNGSRPSPPSLPEWVKTQKQHCLGDWHVNRS